MAISAEERERRNRGRAKKNRDRKSKYSAELEQSVEQNTRKNVELKTKIERYERDMVAVIHTIAKPSSDDGDKSKNSSHSQGPRLYCGS